MAQRRQNRLSRIALLIGLPLMLLVGIAYFYTQTITGDFGTFERESLKARFDTMERDIARTEALVAARRARNSGLRDGSVNLDLLDERARKELGMLRTDEVFLIDN